MSEVGISIIVPIYHGKEYIPYMIKQVECCKRKIDSDIQVELLFVNDCPEDEIENYESADVVIRAFNTDTNCGIQSARIKGIGLSLGKYVLLLDQDDKIREDYLYSQLENIEKYGADASVCRAIHENRPVYNSQNCFEWVIHLEHMMKDNYIISPGQVLIRKDSLPIVWKNNLLRNNGADDWLLWLCMLAEKKKFVLNDKCLYEHTVNGHNASHNTNKMIDSAKEVVQILKSQAIFPSSQIIDLERNLKNSIRYQIQVLDKFKRMFYFYESWMCRENHTQLLSMQLKKKQYKNIAIYGLSPMGKQFIRELKKNNEIHVEYVIDREANYYKADGVDVGITLCTTEEICEQKNVDAIVVTIVEQEQLVVKELQKIVNIPVLYMEDILFDRL